MPSPLYPLPLGAVRPAGWLLDQLRLAAAGQTGTLEAIWADVGPDNAWLGGDGDDWERGPYYADGLLPLAHLLASAGDSALLAQANRWVEGILGSQRDDGWFGPASNDDWWPRMVALKVLVQHAEATGDARVPAFLERYFGYQLQHLPARPLEGWGKARGTENALCVLWLHRRTGQEWLLELVDLLLSQTENWSAYLANDLITEPASHFDHRTHVVNVAMGLKLPAVQYLRDGDPAHRGAVERAYANLYRHHGLVHGMFSGDEWLAGRAPSRGVETCAVVEHMFTLENLVAIFGDARYADRLETIAYNTLPAALTADMTAHQYHQQANQVLVNVAHRHWTMSGDDANIFGLEPHFGCCTANLHQGWPKFAASLWATTAPSADGTDALTAVAYGPCTVETTVAGVPVRIDERTAYPFEQAVTMQVRPDRPVRFGLRLRVPGWCHAPRVLVNGEPVSDLPAGPDYACLDREWQPGDEVVIEVPAGVRSIPRDGGAVGLAIGPLVLALAVGETWTPIAGAPGPGNWQVEPSGPWNVALALPPADGNGALPLPVEQRAPAAVPFALADAPVQVRATGSLVPQWRLVDNSAGPVPASPVEATAGSLRDVTLVPYGCARIRVAEFPTSMVVTDPPVSLPDSRP